MRTLRPFLSVFALVAVAMLAFVMGTGHGPKKAHALSANADNLLKSFSGTCATATAAIAPQQYTDAFFNGDYGIPVPTAGSTLKIAEPSGTVTLTVLYGDD